MPLVAGNGHSISVCNVLHSSCHIGNYLLNQRLTIKYYEETAVNKYCLCLTTNSTTLIGWLLMLRGIGPSEWELRLEGSGSFLLASRAATWGLSGCRGAQDVESTRRAGLLALEPGTQASSVENVVTRQLL